MPAPIGEVRFLSTVPQSVVNHIIAEQRVYSAERNQRRLCDPREEAA
jgi:hypothetical protein